MYDSSLQRRVTFAARSRLFFDGFAAYPPVSRLLLRGQKYDRLGIIHRLLDKAAVTSHDLWESVRTGGAVPFLGEPRAAIVTAKGRIRQHPRFRIYWNDLKRKVEIGVHVGIDFVRNGGRYYPVEINLDAAMYPARRKLYNEEIDPIISGLVETAVRSGYENLVVFNHYWDPDFVKEMVNATDSANLKLILASVPFADASATSPIIALPAELPEKTLCVPFQAQGGPLDHLLNDKAATSVWLQRETQDGGLLATVNSSARLFIPPLDSAPCWPNLVVKLSGVDWGRSVVFAKVRTEEEAVRFLKMANPEGKPQVFQGSRLENLLTKLRYKDQVVYQQFIPPERTEAGYPRIVRAHFLFTPLQDVFLSAHYVVSDHKPPDDLPFGLVPDVRGFVVNRNVGGHYERTDPNLENELRIVAGELGAVIRKVVSGKFVVESEQSVLP